MVFSYDMNIWKFFQIIFTTFWSLVTLNWGTSLWIGTIDFDLITDYRNIKFNVEAVHSKKIHWNNFCSLSISHMTIFNVIWFRLRHDNLKIFQRNFHRILTYLALKFRDFFFFRCNVTGLDFRFCKAKFT